MDLYANNRYGYRSTVISGQLPVSKWHELFEDSTVADAILDRLVHNAYRFERKGPIRRRIEPDSITKSTQQQPATDAEKSAAKTDTKDKP